MASTFFPLSRARNLQVRERSPIANDGDSVFNDGSLDADLAWQRPYDELERECTGYILHRTGCTPDGLVAAWTGGRMGRDAIHRVSRLGSH